MEPAPRKKRGRRSVACGRNRDFAQLLYHRFLASGGFYFFPGPEHKKPESPGKAKKDYLPTSKRHVFNRFPGGLAVILDGCSRSRLDSIPGRVARQTRGEKKKNIFSFMVKKNSKAKKKTDSGAK